MEYRDGIKARRQERDNYVHRMHSKSHESLAQTTQPTLQILSLLTGQLLQVPALYWRDARHAQLPQYIAINVLENIPFIVLVME